MNSGDQCSDTLSQVALADEEDITRMHLSKVSKLTHHYAPSVTASPFWVLYEVPAMFFRASLTLDHNAVCLCSNRMVCFE